MKLFELFEMAVPTPAIQSVTYYHGTQSKETAISIWKHGLDPKFTEIKYGDSNPFQRPVAGKVYLASELRYGIIYAIGGDILGHDPRPSAMNEIGYLFVFNGNDLVDVQPDEDSVGQFLWAYFNRSSEYVQKNFANIINSRVVANVAYSASRLLSDSTLKKLKDGEAVWETKVGKAMLKRMSDNEKQEFIHLGAHVAHDGKIVPYEMWSIPCKKSKLLKKDGSNFFEIAKLVKKR